MSIPKPTEFVFKTPLYELLSWKDEDAQIQNAEFQGTDGKELEIQNIVCFKGKVDGFCAECGKDSTFQRIDEVPNTWDTSWFMASRKTVRFTLTCARSVEHKIEVIYKVLPEFEGIIKIGQFPTIASLMKGDVKKYRKVLKKQFSEYTRAIGLISHGVGIGSFVYLRRIFEVLIEEAHQLAIKEQNWNEEEYAKLRMNEKIKVLKKYLPKFLVDNAKMYGILSKGIHELSEQETMEFFPAVKLGIELILDEKIKIQEQKDKEKEATDLLNKIAKKIEEK
jgi:hypothetical protein